MQRPVQGDAYGMVLPLKNGPVDTVSIVTSVAVKCLCYNYNSEFFSTPFQDKEHALRSHRKLS